MDKARLESGSGKLDMHTAQRIYSLKTALVGPAGPQMEKALKSLVVEMPPDSLARSTYPGLIDPNLNLYKKFQLSIN